MVTFEKKINILLILCTIFVTGNVFCQQKIKDNFSYKVVYDLSYKLDSLHLENVKHEDMVLFLSQDASAFSSKAKTVRNQVIINGNKGHTSPAAVTDFQYVIIKNHKTKSLAFTQEIVEDSFYYPQDLALFEWKILNEQKTIGDYKVQKATTSFAGRDYVAWFTMEIPISDGPYKFNGLPGLILEIADTKDEYIFKLKSFEKLTPEIPFDINFKNYILTTQEKLREVYLLYSSDTFTYVKNHSSIQIEISPENHKAMMEIAAAKLKRENNQIEKN